MLLRSTSVKSEFSLMTDADNQTVNTNEISGLRIPRQSPQISRILKPRLDSNSRNHTQVNSISYVIFKTVSVTESYSTLLQLAILGYNLAIQIKRRFRFYQGFAGFYWNLKTSKSIGFGYTKNIDESIPRPIQQNGPWMCLFTFAVSFFNDLGINRPAASC